MREYKVELAIPFIYYVEAEMLEDAIDKAYEEYAEEEASASYEAEVVSVKEV